MDDMDLFLFIYFIIFIIYLFYYFLITFSYNHSNVPLIDILEKAGS